jgi:16S rRNA (adenine(1408)-N(1))-methyltransferase
VGAEPAVMSGVTRLMRPGATLSLLLSATERDGAAGVPLITERTLFDLVDRYGRYGLTVTDVGPATAADVTAAHSTWGKRLGVGRKRPAWVLRAVRDLSRSCPSEDVGTRLVSTNREPVSQRSAGT